MIAMQYKIVLPNNYNMDIIKNRIKENGHKTDGFDELLYKFYLVIQKDKGNSTQNEYSPMYLWKSHLGMNKFIFNGFYDNILNSFGWQNINVGMPLYTDFNANFENSKYVVELENSINKTSKMQNPTFSLDDTNTSGKVLIYNPTTWKYTEFYFYEKLPIVNEECLVYEILHISK